MFPTCILFRWIARETSEYWRVSCASRRAILARATRHAQMPNLKSKMQKTFIALAILVSSILAPAAVDAVGISVGAAPKGDAQAVATKIIKENHPACNTVSGATRHADGSIRAQCNGTSFLVFTVFNPKEGRTIELALNCTAAKKHLNIAC
jgi:hypothetical protein